MLNIYRKDKWFIYKYYKSNVFVGEIKNKLFIKKIKCGRYRICIKNYINCLFIISTVFMIMYIKNMYLLILIFIIMFFVRLIISYFDISKIEDDNNILIGKMNYVIFSHIIKITLFDDEYEIYSHGGNCFSVTKNNMQIALIRTNGKIIMNELNFVIDCLSCYYDLLSLFIILIDSKFYNYVIGRCSNTIYFSMHTYNLDDKHRERTMWGSGE